MPEALPQPHGGSLVAAIARFGGVPQDWIDLSTGINPIPYPAPALPPESLQRLPDPADIARLERLAALSFGAPDHACLALAGAQAAIQMMPAVTAPGPVAILGPTYSEHAISYKNAGFETIEIPDLSAMSEAVSAVVLVNPNNPDGQLYPPETIEALAARLPLVIVDESFADPTPETSAMRLAPRDTLVIQRSFGKFYGLAGLRLGFALGSGATIARLAARAGPWPVSGPALAAGIAAYGDPDWSETTRARLATDRCRLDGLATRAGWRSLGGTDLFGLYDVKDAAAAQSALARAHIWTRRFDHSPGWLRLGLPGPEAHWQRLEAALPVW